VLLILPLRPPDPLRDSNIAVWESLELHRQQLVLDVQELMIPPLENPGFIDTIEESENEGRYIREVRHPCRADCTAID
jgi:hypothetical protein